MSQNQRNNRTNKNRKHRLKKQKETYVEIQKSRNGRRLLRTITQNLRVLREDDNNETEPKRTRTGPNGVKPKISKSSLRVRTKQQRKIQNTKETNLKGSETGPKKIIKI